MGKGANCVVVLWRRMCEIVDLDIGFDTVVSNL